MFRFQICQKKQCDYSEAIFNCNHIVFVILGDRFVLFPRLELDADIKNLDVEKKIRSKNTHISSIDTSIVYAYINNDFEHAKCNLSISKYR